MTSGVYIMTNKANRHRYIGYSEDIESRLEENQRQLREGTFGEDHQLLMDDYQKYGAENFISGILEVTDNDPQSMKKQAEYWKKMVKPEYNNDSSAT